MALRRARAPIIASGVTYVSFVLLGIALAGAGWPIAVDQRDSVVNGARASPITQAYQHGDRLQAALLDFGANLGLGAIPTSIAGLSVVGPFPMAAYRGWVGGVVSIDREHNSRLASASEAVYYLVTLMLQLVGFVFTMGAGVHVGLSSWKARNDRQIPSILGLRIPAFALRDAGWLYVAATPFFLVGSLWEFLSQGRLTGRDSRRRLLFSLRDFGAIGLDGRHERKNLFRKPPELGDFVTHRPQADLMSAGCL